ncbi:MAG: hypothetical protein J7M18_02455 [Candidatus Eremiobacteraeota bacterium]|nr:hypothetical protein [Candidatus Eremiobacteraeota bacterium]
MTPKISIRGKYIFIVFMILLMMIPGYHGCQWEENTKLYHLLKEKVEITIDSKKLHFRGEYVFLNPAEKEDYDLMTYKFPCIEGMGKVHDVHIWLYPGMKKGRKITYGWGDMCVIFPVNFPPRKQSLLIVSYEQDIKKKMGSCILMSAKKEEPPVEKLELYVRLPVSARLKYTTIPLREEDAGEKGSFRMIRKNLKPESDLIFTWK